MGHPGRDIVGLTPARIAVGVGAYRAEFLNWGFYDTRWWRNYFHTHSFYEICYAYAGHGVFRSDAAHYPVSAGTIFVARPGDVHEIVSNADDPLGIYFWSYTLVQDQRAPAYHDRARNGVLSDDATWLLDQFADEAGKRVTTDVGHIPRLLEILAAEARHPAPGSTQTVRALAVSLLIATARAVVDTDTAVPPEQSIGCRESSHRQAIVQTMSRYLQDNYNRHIRVRDVAAQVHLSERHAERLFRRTTRTSIYDYLTRLRLTVAAQLLVEQDSSIKQTARSCGYPDVRRFSTAFRRYWGMPPASFRRHNGTVHLDQPQPMATDTDETENARRNTPVIA